MAETEKKIILGVDTELAVKNVSELRDYIKGLKDDLNDESQTLEQNEATIKELTQAQNKLREVMHTSNMTINDAIKYNEGVGKTYNELVADLAELKKAYRTTNDVMAQNAIAKNIKRVSDNLKEQDERMGSHKRNVGAYADSIIQAFGKMGGASRAAAAGADALTRGLTAMSATPIIAVLSMVVNLLGKVGDAMKGSEEQTANMTLALAPFKAAGDAVTNMLQKMAGWIGDATAKLTGLLVKLKILKAEALDYQEEAKEELRLMRERRKVNEQNAEDEQAISELRAKMAEKDKYTAAERLEFADEWKKKMMDIAARNKKIAEDELALLQKQTAHTGTSSEELDKLSEAKIKVTKATTDYNNKLRECNAQLQEIKRSAAKAGDGIKELAEDIIDEELYTFEDELYKIAIEDPEKALEMRYEMERKLRDKELKEKEAAAKAEAEAEKQKRDEIKQTIEDIKQAKEEEAAAAKRTKDAYVDSAYGAINATSAILDSLASAMEENGEATESQLNAIKGMRIASATIDTIAGAVGAFTTAAANPGGIPGMIIGAANAAAVTAAGIAQITKISQTTISKNGGASSASISAPTISTSIPETAIMDTASTNEAIDKISKSQRVYILESDIQGASRRNAAKVAETSFK